MSLLLKPPAAATDRTIVFCLLLGLLNITAATAATIDKLGPWNEFWQENAPWQADAVWPANQYDTIPALLKPRRQSTDDSQVQWLTTRLPTTEIPEATLFIPPVYLYLSVYLDAKPLRVFDNQTAARGMPWYLLDLPPGYGGRNLTLRITSDYTKIGPTGDVLLGTRSHLLGKLIRDDLNRLVVSLLTGLAGVLALAMTPWRRAPRAYLAFGIYAVAATAWLLSQSYVKQLIWPATDIWFYIWLTGLLVMLPAFLQFVEVVFCTGSSKLLQRLRWAYMILVAVSLSGWLFAGNSETSRYALDLVRLFYLAGAIAVVWHVGRLALAANHNARLLLAAFTVLGLFTLHDVMLALAIVAEGRTLAHWGILALVLGMAIILARHIESLFIQLDATSKKLRKNSQERALMVQELHDGLGGLASNISLLAEVSARQSTDETVRRNLAAISEMARESLTEIRGFMHSLDDDEQDWNSFVADLRRFGTLSLEPHDIELQLTDAIRSNLPPASPWFRLNVFRIYREAIANIVRHAGARHVRVEIVARPGYFMLEICDDGNGFPGKAETGRGIAIMTARARKLGGNLRISEVHPGTRLRLELPLPEKSPLSGMGNHTDN